MIIKMGEESKSLPFDSASSKTRPKSIITNAKLRNNLQEYREIIPIKESFKKISQEFNGYLPSYKQVPHGIIDAALLSKTTDSIIALCYEKYLIHYDIISDTITEARLPLEITSIHNTKDEKIIIGLSPNEIIIIDSKSFKIIKQIAFENPENCCIYTLNEMLLSTSTELFIIDPIISLIKTTGLTFNKLTSIDVSNTEDVICSDSEGIKKYSSSFELLYAVSTQEISLIKFSDQANYIIAVTTDQILILSETLVKIRSIYNFNTVTDLFYQDKYKSLTFCDSRGEV